MTAAARRLTPYEEHLFWIEVLEDHGHFLHDHLSPEESTWVRQAAAYIEAFAGLRRQLQQLGQGLPLQSKEMVEFSRSAYQTALGYYRLEGHAQSKRITNELNVNLTPSYFNGTLGENQEYLRILSFYVQGRDAPELPLVATMDLWLEDQLGHAVLLRNVLDPAEVLLTERAVEFSRLFQAHMAKNRAIQGYLRFTPPGFPVQQQFATDVRLSVQQFYVFIGEIVKRYEGTRLLSRTTLRFLEHHFPESCYFMRKLALFDPTLGPDPDCPLTKPSFRE
jgi:hypothetical protein